ncbi:hypothetical protein FACS1894111_03260 [Clostridia bacterium]|nr:hypothetical protein FACS1894111_03260 [Clostridia bacterium]
MQDNNSCFGSQGDSSEKLSLDKIYENSRDFITVKQKSFGHNFYACKKSERFYYYFYADFLPCTSCAPKKSVLYWKKGLAFVSKPNLKEYVIPEKTLLLVNKPNLPHRKDYDL